MSSALHTLWSILVYYKTYELIRAGIRHFPRPRPLLGENKPVKGLAPNFKKTIGTMPKAVAYTTIKHVVYTFLYFPKEKETYVASVHHQRRGKWSTACGTRPSIE